MEKSYIAIYDFRTNNEVYSLEEIISKPILFIVSVYNNALSNEKWHIVGRLPLEESLKILPIQFMQDALNPQNFELYDPNNGQITPATIEQCINLERAAVWEAEHVVDRIRGHYAGKLNIWVEDLKIKT